MTTEYKNINSIGSPARCHRKIRTGGLGALDYVARDGFAWPGGYELVLLTVDGGTLCRQCVFDNYAQIYHDTAFDGWSGTGWCASGVYVMGSCSDDDCSCDHCGRLITCD